MRRAELKEHKQCAICRHLDLNTCFILGSCSMSQSINKYCHNYEEKCAEFSLDLRRLETLE